MSWGDKDAMREAYENVLGFKAPTAGTFMPEDSNVKVDEIATAVANAVKPLKYRLEKQEEELKEAYAEVRVLYKIINRLTEKEY